MAVVRSGGVTASAIIALLGSVLTGAFALVTLLGAAVLTRPEAQQAMAQQPQAPPVSPVVASVVMGVVLMAFAAWGTASAVGVLRLRTWGRTSFLAFGGVMAAFGALNVFGSLMVAVLLPSLPLPDPQPPRGFLTGIVAAMAVVSLAVCGLGAWWLIFFNRRNVKAQFTDGQVAASERVPIPVRVLLVAWLLVGAALGGPLALASVPPLPAFILGFELHGWTARLVMLCQFGAAVVAGIGLLRRRFAAHALAIGVMLFSILNFLLIVAIPGRLTRLLTIYQSTSTQALPTEFVESMRPLVIVMGLGANLALVALLVSARGAYRRACLATR